MGLTHVSHSQLLKRAVYSRFQGQKIQSSSKTNQLQLQPSGLITLSHVFRPRLGRLKDKVDTIKNSDMRSCGRINIERFFGEVFSTSYILTATTFTFL